MDGDDGGVSEALRLRRRLIHFAFAPCLVTRDACGFGLASLHKRWLRLAGNSFSLCALWAPCSPSSAMMERITAGVCVLSRCGEPRAAGAVKKTGPLTPAGRELEDPRQLFPPRLLSVHFVSCKEVVRPLGRCTCVQSFRQQKGSVCVCVAGDGPKRGQFKNKGDPKRNQSIKKYGSEWARGIIVPWLYNKYGSCNIWVALYEALPC